MNPHDRSLPDQAQSPAKGHAQRRLNALPPPGRAPYGYCRTEAGYVVDRAAAPVVQAFFEQFLLFGSLRGAVRYLADRYDHRISPSTGLRWLTSPVYRGHLAYGNGDVIRETHEALMQAEEAAQIDRLLVRNRQLPRRAASSVRSLSGLVKCEHCRSSFTVVKAAPRQRSRADSERDEYLYLRPTACSGREGSACGSLRYEPVLQQLIQQIGQEFPIAIEQMARSPMAAQLGQAKQSIEQGIIHRKELIQQLPTLLETGLLTPELVKIRQYQLQTEISQLEQSRSSLPPENLRSIAQTVSIPEFWADLSEAERRVYFRELLRRVWVQGDWGRDGTWTLRLEFLGGSADTVYTKPSRPGTE